MMKHFPLVLILCCFLIEQTYSVEASLKLLSYDPATFNLSFTQNISLPRFQILLNNENVNYKMVSAAQFSDSFLIEAIQHYQHTTQIQVYTLRFNEPLNIAGGTLSLNDFVLRSQKPHIYPTDMKWLGIILIVLMYLACLVDIGGMWLVQFIQIYIILTVNSKYWTTLDEVMANNLLFGLTEAGFVLQPVFNQSQSIFRMVTPFILFILAGLLGLLLKFILKGHTGYKQKIVKDFFTFRFFITVGLIFVFAMISNALNFTDHYNKFSGGYYICGCFLSYMGIAVPLSFVCFGFAVINPKFNFDDKQLKEYQKSSYFAQFTKFTNGVIFQCWQKRNMHFILLIKKIIIIVIACKFHNFYGITLIAQVLHLFYTFTVKPYKFQFYNNTSIIIQTIIVFFYFYIFQTDIYFSMSDEIITHKDISDFMIRRSIFFAIIVLLLLAISVYEAYEGCKAFFDEIKGVKLEQSQQKNQEMKQLTVKTQMNDNEDSKISSKWNKKSLLKEMLEE